MKSILRKFSKRVEKSEKPEKPKETRRRVGFWDEIGKPLVEYRELPPLETLVTSQNQNNASSSSSQSGGHHHHHEKTSGRLISTWRHGIDSRMKWIVLPVKSAMPPKKNGRAEMRMIEEKRLDDNNISRAPLFGNFDAIEPQNLYSDAIIRARESVPIIPTGDSGEIQKIEEVPQQNTYQQIFDEAPPTPPPMVTSSVFNLMEQLKQRGLIPAENLPASPSSSSDVISNIPMPSRPRRPSRWNSNGWKKNQNCTFFMNRPNGCTRGDQCRFEHDAAQRDRRQLELQENRPKDENWRQRPSYSKNSEETRRRRSRSPQHHRK